MSTQQTVRTHCTCLQEVHISGPVQTLWPVIHIWLRSYPRLFTQIFTV